MILTEDVINMICPKHDNTNCNDEHTENQYYETQDKTFRGIVIEREWVYKPCSRCFLLECEGMELEQIEALHNIRILPTVELLLIQPEIEITIKEKKIDEKRG